jgi:uncharacterized RDD family membrane protein YckC
MLLTEGEFLMQKISDKVNHNHSNYGGVGNRIMAFLLDIILLIFLSTGLIVLLLKIFEDAANINSNSYNIIVNSTYIFPIVCFFYFTLLESSTLMTTLGKRCMRLVVVDYDLNKITFMNAVIRFLTKSIVFIGFIFILPSKKNQALHDIIAKTIVIKK